MAKKSRTKRVARQRRVAPSGTLPVRPRNEVGRSVYERFVPPGVVVEGLNGLRSAIHAARKSRTPIRKPDMRVRDGRGWIRVRSDSACIDRAHALPGVVRRACAQAWSDGHTQTDAGHKPALVEVAHACPRARAAASREYLQSVIQELEAANEELQSAKEELHGRNEELSRVNGDLLNLLASVRIAIAIVGADLHIRWFTPMAEKVLNPNIEGANLQELIAECVDTILPIEREVRDRQGRWFSLRIRPYRSTENRIEGAVLALFDIDTPKRYDASVRSALELAEAVLQNALQPTAFVDSAFRVRSANAPFVELFRLPETGFRGRPLTEIAGGGDGLQQLPEAGDITTGTSEAVTLRLRPRHRSRGVVFLARTFLALDGTSDRVVLLTAAGGPPADLDPER